MLRFGTGLAMNPTSHTGTGLALPQLREVTTMRVALLAVGAIVLGFAWLTTVRADEKIPLDQVPEAVLKAVKERFPKGEILSAEREREDGRIQYELKVRDGGKIYEVEVTAEGRILEVELEDD